MTDPESVRALLTTVAEPPGEPSAAPLSQVLTIAHGIRRRRRVRSVVLAAALVVAVALPVAVFGTRANQAQPAGPAPVPSATGYPATGHGTVAALSTGHWSALPGAPIVPRSGAATVWTGRELILWGGTSDDGIPHRDGAAYDPATNRWEVLPQAPMPPLRGLASVWTGTAMFILGGAGGTADCALYDPQTHQWHRIQSGPLPWRGNAQAVWTGHEVVVLTGGSLDGTRSYPYVAGYDPATNRWHRMPSLPVRPGYQLFTVSALAANGSVYVLATSSHTEPWGSGSRIQFASDLWRCDGDCTAGWRTDAPSDAVLGLHGPLWTGMEILVPADNPFLGVPGPIRIGLHGWRLRPGAGWRPMAHGPVDDSPHASAWTGGALVSVDLAGHTAAWDPVADRWTRLPDAPLTVDNDSATAWTGTHLLVLDPHGTLLSFGS
jgi:hypothetical protein